jgi:hypothetical protein
MSSRMPRWSCLQFFAICNLAFWVVAAVGIGVLASDIVDLGLESFIREQQAALVALGKQPLLELPSQTPRPTTVAARKPTESPSASIEENPTVAVAIPSPRFPMTPYATNYRMTPYATSQRPTPYAPTEEPTPRIVQPASNTPLPSPQEPSVIGASAPLLLADPSLADLMRLDAEIRRSAQGRPVQIRYGEAALNREITDLLASYADLPYRNVQADLQRDWVVLKGDVAVIGFEIPTEVQGRVVARDCRPEAEIESFSLGGLLTPTFIKDQVKAMVLASLDWYPPDYPLCLEQIVLEQDRVTLYGSSR